MDPVALPANGYMNEAQSVLFGNSTEDASEALAHVDPSLVLVAGAPSKPRYWIYVVGKVKVASPTVQVISFLSLKVFGVVVLSPDPTQLVSVSVIRSRLVLWRPSWYTVT